MVVCTWVSNILSYMYVRGGWVCVRLVTTCNCNLRMNPLSFLYQKTITITWSLKQLSWWLCLIWLATVATTTELFWTGENVKEGLLKAANDDKTTVRRYARLTLGTECKYFIYNRTHGHQVAIWRTLQILIDNNSEIATYSHMKNLWENMTVFSLASSHVYFLDLD